MRHSGRSPRRFGAIPAGKPASLETPAQARRQGAGLLPFAPYGWTALRAIPCRNSRGRDRRGSDTERRHSPACRSPGNPPPGPSLSLCERNEMNNETSRNPSGAGGQLTSDGRQGSQRIFGSEALCKTSPTPGVEANAWSVPAEPQPVGADH